MHLSKFHGGLKLAGHKAMSADRPIIKAAIPDVLTVPLQQHIGVLPELLVAVGDKVLKGQCLARASETISASIHAPTSGTIIEIDKLPVPHPSGLPALCIRLQADGLDQWRERQPLGDDYKNTSRQVLLDLIQQAGIVGLGGATFPTAVKLQSCVHQRIETLIINGAECEPYITCDDMLMREQAQAIVQGSDIIRHLLNVNECMIAVEDNKPVAIEALRAAISELHIQEMQVVSVPTLYPTGGEKQLIKVVTGKDVPSGGRPADIGVLCQNVATASSVYRAVYFDEPLISRIVTVTGEAVNQPANYEALIGTPMSALIAQSGGYSADIGGLIMGGPMMGFAVADDELPVTKACNCLLTRTVEQMKPPAVSACIRCGDCVKVCPVDLLPQQLYWYSSAKNFDRAQDIHLFDCIECGCCSFVCPSHIPLVQFYRFAKTEIWAQEKDRKKSDKARERHEFREQRIAREKAEREEKLRQKKEMLAKKKEAEGQPADTIDPKKAAIDAALARVKAKKAAADVPPKNTDNLTEQQQQKIREADERRQHSHPAEPTPASHKQDDEPS